MVSFCVTVTFIRTVLCNLVTCVCRLRTMDGVVLGICSYFWVSKDVFFGSLLHRLMLGSSVFSAGCVVFLRFVSFDLVFISIYLINI